MVAPDEATPTITELLLARSDDQRTGLVFEDQRWSWAAQVTESADRAALLRSLRRRNGPFHVGVLLDNLPEYAFLLGGAALAGAVLVGLNTGRRGEALARDVRLANCQVVLTDSRYVELLDGIQLGVRVLDLDSAAWHMSLFAHRHSALDPEPVAPDDPLLLLFTSGTTGEPKAVPYSHRRIARRAAELAGRLGIDHPDTTYLSTPLFHAAAVQAGWAVALATGATIALRRRFSAGGFLDDVHAFGATYATYVGKPLAHVLAVPPEPRDANNPLRVVYGCEATPRDADRFADRFGCRVVDEYLSTEGGIALDQPDERPVGALGRLVEGTTEVLHPATGRPCPPATFDTGGRLLNQDDAVGELVSVAGTFPGYYGDERARAQRLRDGRFFSGDLVYRDDAGFCYFVGRLDDWLLVDGRRVGTVATERILLRHDGVSEVAVYAVPGRTGGDQVMAAVVLCPGAAFEPEAFVRFLAEQPDLAPEQVPRFVRLTSRLPRTPTYKVLRRTLAGQRWQCQDPVWWREGADLRFRPLTPDSAPIRLDWGARHVRR